MPRTTALHVMIGLRSKARSGIASAGLAFALATATGCATPPASPSAAPGGASSRNASTKTNGGSRSGGESQDAIDRAAIQEVTIHVGEEWFPFRADGLGVSIDDARERDASFEKAPPPGTFWDRQVATEAWGLWTELCSQCHGGSRRLSTVLEWPAPSHDWGDAQRRYFNRHTQGRSIFQTIMTGARARRGNVDMPAWRGRLTHEQIWSMVYFISQASNVGDVR